MTTDPLIHEVTRATFVEAVRPALAARQAVTGERIDEISGYALLSPDRPLRPLLLVAEAVGLLRAVPGRLPGGIVDHV